MPERLPPVEADPGRLEEFLAADPRWERFPEGDASLRNGGRSWLRLTPSQGCREEGFGVTGSPATRWQRAENLRTLREAWRLVLGLPPGTSGEALDRLARVAALAPEGGEVHRAVFGEHDR